ncbi:MAG: hypothetical protein QRY71_05535 [Candidatus Rhabdochlamydia sp.]
MTIASKMGDAPFVSLFNLLVTPGKMIASTIPVEVSRLFRAFAGNFGVGGQESFWVKPVIVIGKYLSAHQLATYPELGRLIGQAKIVKDFIMVPKSIAAMPDLLTNLSSPIVGGKSMRRGIVEVDQNVYGPRILGCYTLNETAAQKTVKIAQGVLSAIGLLKFAKLQGLVNGSGKLVNQAVSHIVGYEASLCSKVEIISSLWAFYDGLKVWYHLEDAHKIEKGMTMLGIGLEMSKLAVMAIKFKGNKDSLFFKKMEVGVAVASVIIPMVQKTLTNYMQVTFKA